MRITIGENTKAAMATIEIDEYPFTYKELSSKFRTAIKKAHPDKSGDEESTEAAKKIILAYAYLKNLALAEVTDEEKSSALEMFEKDSDIFSLWESCPECGGHGKRKQVTSGTRFCPACGGIGQRRPVRCFECRGSGIFVQRNGREVQCRKCGGSGSFRWVCKHCKGVGFVFDLNPITTYYNCFKCGGAGKIKLNPFNPVIRKGAVMI